MKNVQMSKDGIHLKPAKEEPYMPTWWENILCAFGFHKLCASKKYDHTAVCFRCGKRRIY